MCVYVCAVVANIWRVDNGITCDDNVAGVDPRKLAQVNGVFRCRNAVMCAYLEHLAVAALAQHLLQLKVLRPQFRCARIDDVLRQLNGFGAFDTAAGGVEME